MKSRTFFIFGPLLVWLVFLLSPKALRAGVDENALWSLQFMSVSISEALKQITQTTGIKIIPPSRLGNQVITKSYKNQTIEHILKDIFRDMNYALVWSYGEKGIDSVKILALDKVGGSGARYSPKRGLSPPTRSMMDREPEDTDSEVSAEPEQKEDDQAQAESKEEDREQMSSSGESDEETPVPPKKLPVRSDEGLEKRAEEPPSVVDQNEDEESRSSLPAEQKGSNER